MASSKSTETTTGGIPEMMQQVQRAFGSSPLAAPQMEEFWKAQEQLLDEAEAFSRHWFERRHVAARTAMETARELREGGASDPGSAMKAMGDWQAESVQRMVADWQEWLELCQRCAGHMSAGGMDAQSENTASARKTSGTRKAPASSGNS
ncbi:hypothetical protein [Rhodosalinus sp. 5P4]|uniref:hypothetical protein n=1 Tax=Rhodosalinus sp. 5P4 TaxID=3239196 RepID=UPI003525341F